MASFAIMNSKGQLTIPRGIRESLKLLPGTRFHIRVVDGDVLAVPQNLELSELAGLLGSPPGRKSMTLEEIDQAILDAVAEDDRRIGEEWNREFG